MPFGLALMLLPVGGRAESVAGSGSAGTEPPQATAFDLIQDEGFVFTTRESRLLSALAIAAGMIALAFFSAWVVIRLGDRGPSGGPAPLVDLPADRSRRPD